MRLLKRTYICLAFIFPLIAVIFPIGLAQPAVLESSCAYLSEDFSGSSGNKWSSVGSGTWNIQGGEADGQLSLFSTGVSMYETSFLPSGYFTVDVDVEAVSMPQSGGFGIQPYTTGSNYFQVSGKSLDGIGAFVFNSGDAYLFGWDVNGKAWFTSGKIAAAQPVTSIGVAYSSSSATLRINKQNTASQLSGNFTGAYQLINKLDLMLQGASAHARFDNVCAGQTAPSAYTLTVSTSGTGSGTVSSSPSGISCGSDCTENYNQAASVILTATPASGSTFSGWSGGGCSGTGTCTVTMSADTTVTASFSVSGGSGGGSGGGSCTATIDPSLKLTIPIIKYTDSLLGTIYLWANMDYVLNPSKVLFKLSDYGIIQNVSGYTCTMSTLDTDLTIHVNELLYNGSNFWLKLAYDTSLSSGNNAYFYAADFGTAAPSEAVDVTELISSLFGAAGRYNPSTSPAIIETVKTTYQTGGVAALINLAITAYPQLVKGVTNGILIDFGNGYITKNGSTMTGSIEITHSNVVRTGRRTTGNFALVAKNVHKDTKFMGDGSASGAVDLTSDANNKVTGDITINGIINSSGGLKTSQTNEIINAASSGTSGTVTGSAHFDEIKCPNYPVSGGITFTLNGQTQAVTFNDKCNGSYAINGITQGGGTIITSLSPASGKPGDTVTITGSGFGATQGSSTVKFVGTTATVVSWSATSIVVTVPNITSTGDVVVNIGGTDSNGVTFTVLNQCSTQQVAGADTPETRVIDLGKNHGTFQFDYETYSQKDRITVTYEGTTLFDTGCVGASGTKNLTYSGSSTSVTVTVQPNCAGGSGTSWNFTVYCPK